MIALTLILSAVQFWLIWLLMKASTRHDARIAALEIRKPEQARAFLRHAGRDVAEWIVEQVNNTE